MRFAVAGKSIERPRALTAGNLRRGSRVRGVPFVPILWGIGNPPNICGIVERHSDQKIPSVPAKGKAIGHAPGCAASTGQLAEKHWSFEGKRLRGAYPATLRADHQRDAR